ncbi:MAG: GNAT family N-acetyltransferase [Chloroflexota bacterium]|nr:GNAT family N-acetyltransferase [Chloroflexota bacterium]
MAASTAGRITITPATADDLSDVRAINDVSSSVRDDARLAYLARAVAGGECLLAHDDGAVAGFAVWDRSFYGHPFLALLVVRPRARRRGVASALVRRVEALCGGDRLFTSTNTSNTAMQRLCDALGFERSGIIDNLDEGDPELVYCKRVHDGRRRPAGGDQT